MRSRPVSSVTKAGGAYVLGGANCCPQGSGPLFTVPGLVVPAGGQLRRPGAGTGGAGGDGEERVGDHGQGGMPVPGPVLADLVVVQAGLALRVSEAVLDPPARSRHRDELGKGDRAR